jgi:hypothetical protein
MISDLLCIMSPAFLLFTLLFLSLHFILVREVHVPHFSLAFIHHLLDVRIVRSALSLALSVFPLRSGRSDAFRSPPHYSHQRY